MNTLIRYLVLPSVGITLLAATAAANVTYEFRTTSDPTVIGTIDLTWSTSQSFAMNIPLVYDHPFGPAQKQGQPLRAGAYRVVVDVFFNGPNRQPSLDSRGDMFSASIPIRVEGPVDVSGFGKNSVK